MSPSVDERCGPLAGIRIGLLTASVSRAGGGVAEAVIAQAAMIRDAGGEALVFALDDAPGPDERERLSESPLALARVVGPAQIGFAPRLSQMLRDAELDILHLHGIWMYPSRAGLQWARDSGRPYLISPHGMLDPWITARGRAKKAAARIGYERAGWRAACALHALTAAEARDIERESGRDDTLIIPNPGPPATKRTVPPPGSDFLYLGRIHPKKNLVALARGWARASAQGKLDNATLTIAGWGAAADIAELEAALARGPGSARYIGPAFAADKARLLEAARFMVLPSHSEGLPMALLEAWAAGVPTLHSDGCNLPEGFVAGASRRCPTDPEGLADSLADAHRTSTADWSAMVRAGHDLAAGRFSAPVVAARWAEAYRGLIA